MSQVYVREAVGVFDNVEKLDAAIAELEVTAFPRHDISVLGNDNEIKAKLKDGSISLDWLEDYPETPRDISVRPEERTIGTTVLIGVCGYIGGCAAIIAAGPTASTMELLSVIGIGSLIGLGTGLFLAFLMWKKAKKSAQNQMKRGGFLLWVRTPGPDKEKIAQTIMQKHGGKHVHIHSIM